MRPYHRGRSQRRQIVFSPFLAALEARVKAYIAEQVARGVAPWLARMAQKTPKHPPSSLDLLVDLNNQLQSRSGKAWEGYKESQQPKENHQAPTAYEEQKAQEDAWE